MAKAICVKSGLPFEIQYFPYTFERMLHHPIFDLSFTQLSQDTLVQKYLSREFTDIDTRLYFLALLHSTELVEWRTYARPTTQICEMNMLPLLDMLNWLHTLKHPALALPKMAITQDTADLNNVRSWIQAWNQAREDFESGYKELTTAQYLLRKEATLERLIKDQQKEMSQFAGILADWAAVAAEFPTFIVSVNGAQVQLADYWKHILVTCAKTPAHIWRLDIEDMHELKEHLEENMEHGSIYAFNTMKLIREGIKQHEDRLGFSIVAAGNDIETTNVQRLAENAPEEMPVESNYPNKVAYLRDKIRWDMAQKLAKGGK